ncbi:MAG: glycosyltransferase family 2 protein, partial [Chloroflexi bacterium]|nr:glycosyltransferase family 2 protein [Chloroflexota bacterium]
DECLLSIKSATACTYEIIVVDNGSKDGSAQLVQDRHPDAKLIRNTRNRGFAAATNQGTLIARGRYLFMLNPDVVVRSGAIDRLVEFLDSHGDFGLCAPCNTDRDHTIQVSWFPFPTWWALARGRVRHGLFNPLRSPDQSVRPTLRPSSGWIEIDWARGCSLMVDANLYRDLGGLDEGFFLYFEEVDLCKRAHAHGCRCAYIPDSVIVHYRGGSSPPQETVWLDGMLGTYGLRSTYRYLGKHQGWSAQYIMRGIDLLVGCVLLLRSALHRDPTEQAYGQAHGYLLIGEALCLANRKARHIDSTMPNV